MSWELPGVMQRKQEAKLGMLRTAFANLASSYVTNLRWPSSRRDLTCMSLSYTRRSSTVSSSGSLRTKGIVKIYCHIEKN